MRGSGTKAIQRWGAAALLVLSALPAAAQTTAGGVSGTVHDEQGAVIPGATATLTSNTRGTVLTAAINRTGDFVFATVPPDTYTLSVKADGFKPIERKNVVVNANDKLSLGTLVLGLGGVTETVSVSAEATPLQTQSAERSYAVEGQVIQNVAINGRDFFGFAFLAPGVVVNGQPTPTGQASNNMSANGQRPSTNNVTLDGVTDIDTGNNGGPMVAISLDAIQEFKILTSNYQAEYGRSVGAQVSAVTKSGGRDFHGSAYVLRRNSDMNANTWLNNKNTPATPVPPLDNRDIGYTLGGPIYIPGKFNTEKNKLFFFLSQEYQHRLNAQISPQRVRVPTALERAGDFSQTRDSAGALFPYIRDYTTNLPCGPADTRGCFQDGGVIGRIPQSRLYPVGVNILKMYPASNSDGTYTQGFNYVTQDATSQPERQDLFRLDWNVSDRWRVNGKVLNNKSDRLLPYGSFVLASNMPDYSITYLFPRRGYSLNVAGTLNSTTFVEATVGYSHNSIDILPDQSDPQSFTKAALGLSALPMIYPSAVQLDLPPRFNFGGRVGANGTTAGVINAPTLGSNNAPFHNFNTTKDAIGSITKLMGHHTAKAGFYFHHSLKPQSSFANNNGQISFANDASNPFDTGYPFANAILGVYQTYEQASGYFIGNYEYNNMEWFLQDNWKATRKLTLDYGVRFYWMQPQHDTLNQTANFIPEKYDASKAPRLYFPGRDAAGTRVAVDRATGQILPAVYIGRLVPGSGTIQNGVFQAGNGIEDTLYKGSGILVGPRLGFTYDLTGKSEWIIRGGGGVFYDRSQGNSVFDLLGNPPTTLAPRFNNGRLQDVNPNNVLLAPPGLVAYDHSGKIPTTYAFNLGVQMKLPGSSVLDISYVGAINRNQLQARNLNSVPYGAAFLPQNQDSTLAPNPVPGANALPDDFLRPYQGFGDIRIAEPVARSNYNALQTSVNRRFNQGLLLSLSYTWSKALGTVSNDNNNGLTSFDTPRIDGNQDRANYGPMDFDRRHNFIGNFVYEIPKTHAKGILGQIADGWQVSGIYRYQSGQPYNVTVSVPGINSKNFLGTVNTAPPRAVLVGDPGSGHSSDPYRQLNAAAFTIPAVGTIGLDSGRNFLTTAPTNNWDLSLAKAFYMGGARKLEFRIDAFNALNHTQFYTLNTTLTVRSLTDPTPTNLPYDNTGKLVNPSGFGAVTAVRPPRTIQLQARFVF